MALMMKRHSIQGVILPRAQCFQDRFWVHSYPDQDEVVTESECMIQKIP